MEYGNLIVVSALSRSGFPDITNIYDWYVGMGCGGFNCIEYIRLTTLRRPQPNRVYLLPTRAPDISSNPGIAVDLYRVCTITYGVIKL